MALTYSAFYLPAIAILSFSTIKVLLLLISDISKTIEVLPFMICIIVFLVSLLFLVLSPYLKIISFYFRIKGRKC